MSLTSARREPCPLRAGSSSYWPRAAAWTPCPLSSTSTWRPICRTTSWPRWTGRAWSSPSRAAFPCSNRLLASRAIGAPSSCWAARASTFSSAPCRAAGRGHPPRRKMGFGVPLGAWFPMSYDGPDLLPSPPRQRGIFRPSWVEGLLRTHDSARRDCSARLWAMLCLELWMRRWIDGSPSPVTRAA
jgi:hypothetical protein